MEDAVGPTGSSGTREGVPPVRHSPYSERESGVASGVGSRWQGLWRRYGLDAAAVALLWGLCLLYLWRLFSPIPALRLHVVQGDFTNQFYPFRYFAATEWRAGRVPLWNPYVFAGHPFLADVQTAVFYPLSLADSLFGAIFGLPVTALELEMAAHYPLAALFTYLLAKQLTGSRLGALVAAVAFTFSGFLTSYPAQQLAMLESAIWLPLVVLCLELGATRPTSGYRWHVAAGLVLGGCMLAGHPQTAMFVVYTAVAYLLVRTATVGTDLTPHPPSPRGKGEPALTPPSAPLSRLAGRCASLVGEGPGVRAALARALVGTGVFLAVGFAVSAVQVLPTAEFIGLSTRATLPYEAAAYGYERRSLVGILIPAWRGEKALYVGILPLLLAAAALGRRLLPAAWWGESQPHSLWTADAHSAEDVAPADRSAGACPPPDPSRRCPSDTEAGSRTAQVHVPDRADEQRGRVTRLVVAASAALRLRWLAVCATALKRLLQTRPRPLPIAETAHAAAAFPTLFLAALALVAVVLSLGGKTPLFPVVYRVVPGFTLFRDQERIIYLFAFAVSLLAGQGAVCLWSLPVHLARRARVLRLGLAAALGLAGAFALGVYYLGRRNPAAFDPKAELTGGIALYLGLTLASVALLYVWRRADRPRLFGALVVALVAADLFATNLGNNLGAANPDPGPRYAPIVSALGPRPDEYRVRGDNDEVFPPNYGAVWGLPNIAGDTPFGLQRVTDFLYADNAEWRRWQVWNVKYFLSRKPPFEGVEPAFASGGINVYKVVYSLPRAWAVRDVQVASSPADALARVLAPKYHPGDTAVLEEAPSIGPFVKGERPDVRIVSYTSQRVELAARGDGNAILVLADTYYPGWQAYLDGTPVKLHQANYVVRAVELPPGEHRVELVFDPLAFKAGAVVSALALVASVLWLALPLARSRL